MNSFLLELGSEEIPAPMIESALNELSRKVNELLDRSRLNYQSLRVFDSPRRLALLIEGLPDQQSSRRETILGPPQRVALDEEGQFTKAAHGFARKSGVSVEQMEFLQSEKGTYLGFHREEPGLLVPDLLATEIPELLSSLHWPKNMYWEESRFRFVRPIRWLVALWNEEVLPFELAGIRTGRDSRGHRYLGSHRVSIRHPSDYVEALRAQYVLVDLEERQAKIRHELAELVSHDGSSVLEDSDLLLQVERLNEYPQVLRGAFEERFLDIPREVLITVMRHHQKYFAVVDEREQLKPAFLTVINTARDSPMVRTGHERVLKARLEDAAFFWKKDRLVSLEDRVDGLAQVVFQKELGSYLDKTRRISRLCRHLEKDLELAAAALLCKTDLTTEMVFELPELQGIMGGLYARQAGDPEEVWRAIYEHYQPGSMEDDVPSSRNGAFLSLADKLDTLVGCFGIGIVPTGSSDAFALRRQAQGIIRILLERNLNFPLSQLVIWAEQGFESSPSGDEGRVKILDFLEQRIRFILSESGIPYDVLNAVLASGYDDVPAAAARAQALFKIRNDTDFEALAAAFKRIRNILVKSGEQEGEPAPPLLKEAEERALWDHLRRIAPQVERLMAAGDYAAAFRRIATFRELVDGFFDAVLVIDPNQDLRRNRLALLSRISELFLQLADISEIVRRD